MQKHEKEIRCDIQRIATKHGAIRYRWRKDGSIEFYGRKPMGNVIGWYAVSAGWEELTDDLESMGAA